MTSGVYLVGLPGVGKTTVGRHLARRLGLPFVDSDRLIEERIGCSIRDFFEREGEDAFRAWEEAVIDELTRGHARVLSTGGGVVLRAANRQRLRERGWVFYLRATPEILMRRLRHDRTRPLLQVADPLQRLRDLYAVRDPLYRQTAHFVIDAGRLSVGALVNTVVKQLECGAAAPAPDAPR